MARIAHSAITGAFDRVAEALKKNDGDVRQTMQQLRSKGDGEGAYVAGAIEATTGPIADFSELAAAKQTLIAHLAAADTSPSGKANGLSKAELASLPKELGAMVGALLIMSRLEAIPAKPGPKSIKTFEAGIAHVTELMKAADGGNGKLSADENQTLVEALLGEGRATEALAVANMFTIAKARAGKGATVTDARIDDVAAYAVTSIKKRDKGAPGFSNTELDKMPTTWSALFRLGRLSQVGVAKPVVPAEPKPATTPDFMSLRNISDNDVGGVAKARELSDIPEAARAKITKEMKTAIQQFTLDGTVPTVSYEALTVGSETIGWGVFLEMADSEGHNISWNHFFEADGDYVGKEYTGFNGSPSLTGFAPGMRTEHDFYWDYDGFTPTASYSDPEFRTAFADSQTDGNLFLINLARGELFGESALFNYRRDDSNEITEGMGHWETGKRTHEGKEYDIVRWVDVDDSSFTLFFDELASGGGFELALKNFDN